MNVTLSVLMLAGLANVTLRHSPQQLELEAVLQTDGWVGLATNTVPSMVGGRGVRFFEDGWEGVDIQARDPDQLGKQSNDSLFTGVWTEKVGDIRRVGFRRPWNSSSLPAYLLLSSHLTSMDPAEQHLVQEARAVGVTPSPPQVSNARRLCPFYGCR